MNSKKTAVTLEELIRVKRAEQPPPEFWAQFEREMRAKQLAAIIEPKPWWAPFIRVGAQVSRHQVPIGAAAVLLLSFVTIHEYRTTNFSPTFTSEIAAPSVDASAAAQLSTADVARLNDRLAPITPQPESVVAPKIASQKTEAIAAAAVSVGAAAHSAPLVERVPSLSEPTPSARYIAANLAAAQAADPTIMDDVFGSAVRAKDMREPVRDPLAQINTSGGSRRSRLLATALPAAANAGDIAIGTSDRVARHLTEERLYDTISRVGVRGDRVAIKF